MSDAQPANASPRLSPGDHSPVFACKDADGNLFELYVGVTGKPVVMIFCGDKKLSDVAGSKALKDEKVQPLALVSGDESKAHAERAAAGWDIQTLADPGGEITSGFAEITGVDAPSMHVLDPNLRLVASRSVGEGGADLDSWLKEKLTGASHSGKSETISLVPPALIVPRVLEPEDCEWIIGLWRDGQKQEGRVAMGSGDDNRREVVTTMKRREDYVVEDREIENRILNRVMPRLVPELRKIYHFHDWEMEALRVGCYKAQDSGFFKVHRDNVNPAVQHRKYAITINLNTGDYEGGTLRFPEYGNQQFAPPAGGAIVFSCSMLHEVLPVTKGERFVLLTFLTQPPR